MAFSITKNTRYTTLHAIIGWVLAAVWMGVIFFMSAKTGQNLNEGFFYQIKEILKEAINSVFGYHEDPVSPLSHFCEYAVLGALFAHAFRCRFSWLYAFLLALFCASAYGVTDEIHQIFVPGRTCDPTDWLVDTCGAALGAALFVGIGRFCKKRCDRHFYSQNVQS